MKISALRSLEIRKNGVVKHHVTDGRLCVVRKKLCHFVESAHVVWTQNERWANVLRRGRV